MSEGELRSIQCTLAGQINQLVCQKAREAGWPYVMAIRYQQIKGSGKRNSIPFDKLVHVFQEYENACKEGRKPGATQIAKKTGFTNRGSVLSIFKIMDLPAFNPSKRRLDEDQIDAIKNAFKLTFFDARDVAYFVGTTPFAVGYHWHREGRERVFSAYFDEMVDVSWRNVSQFYEAVDAGFTDADARAYAGISKGQATVLEKRRKGLENRIMIGLSKIFPDKEITTPYISA